MITLQDIYNRRWLHFSSSACNQERLSPIYFNSKKLKKWLLSLDMLDLYVWIHFQLIFAERKCSSPRLFLASSFFVSVFHLRIFRIRISVPFWKISPPDLSPSSKSLDTSYTSYTVIFKVMFPKESESELAENYYLAWIFLDIGMSLWRQFGLKHWEKDLVSNSLLLGWQRFKTRSIRPANDQLVRQNFPGLRSRSQNHSVQGVSDILRYRYNTYIKVELLCLKVKCHWIQDSSNSWSLCPSRKWTLSSEAFWNTSPRYPTATPKFLRRSWPTFPKAVVRLLSITLILC